MGIFCLSLLLFVRLPGGRQLKVGCKTSLLSLPHAVLLFKAPQSESNALLRLSGNEEAFLGDVGELKASSLPGPRQLVARIDNLQTLVTVV